VTLNENRHTAPANVDRVDNQALRRIPTAGVSKEGVGEVLRRSVTNIVEGWLLRVKQNDELSRLALSDAERTGHLPRLVEDISLRLSQSSASQRRNLLSTDRVMNR